MGLLALPHAPELLIAKSQFSYQFHNRSFIGESLRMNKNCPIIHYPLQRVLYLVANSWQTTYVLLMREANSMR